MGAEDPDLFFTGSGSGFFFYRIRMPDSGDPKRPDPDQDPEHWSNNAVIDAPKVCTIHSIWEEKLYTNTTYTMEVSSI